MCAQPALVEQRVQSRQGDLRVSYFSPDGDGVRLLPGVEQVSGEAIDIVFTLPAGAMVEDADDEQHSNSVVTQGMLILATNDNQYRFPVTVRGERLPDGSVRMSYSDHAETLFLQFNGDSNTLNLRIQYVDKPLDAALSSARFLELLATTSGVLSLELSAPVEGGGFVSESMEIADLPFAVPESWRADHHNRVRLLDGLYDIRMNTGVEIGYPANTNDEEGLQNFNFVQQAVRGGWVALAVDSFDIQVSDVEAHSLLEELRSGRQVDKAFYFEVPKETYSVFGSEVDLGSSGRYLAAARLKTTYEELIGQLSNRAKEEDPVNLTWEPIEDVPMHVFFDQWPKSSAGSIKRELREYEVLYGVGSERFKAAWDQRELWTQEVQDGSRWLSLIEADEELTAES